MNKDDDTFSFSLRQTQTNFALKRRHRLFVRGHDARCTAVAGGTDLRRIRNLGKPADFSNSPQRRGRHGSVRTRFGVDIDGSKTHYARALGPIGERVRLGVCNGRAVSDVKNVEIVGCEGLERAIGRCSISRTG